MTREISPFVVPDYNLSVRKDFNNVLSLSLHF